MSGEPTADRDLVSRSVGKRSWLFDERQGAPFGKGQGMAVVVGRARNDLRRGTITRRNCSSRFGVESTPFRRQGRILRGERYRRLFLENEI